MLYPCEESHVRNIKLLPLLFIQPCIISFKMIERLETYNNYNNYFVIRYPLNIDQSSLQAVTVCTIHD